MIMATPLLLPGNMCDARMWPDAVRAAMPGAVDVALTGAADIDQLAEIALASAPGPLLPVGFSMGGIVALAMARRAPDRIAGLVLLDTNAGADLPERARERPRQQADVRAGRLEEVVVGELKPNYLAAANRVNAPLLALLRDMALAIGPDGFIAQSEALRTRPCQREVLGTLPVPVLIACGSEDRLCPPHRHAEMAESVAVAELHVVQGAGHMLPLEQPERLADIIAQWRAR